ncbi:ankyrin repeat domain-containing protein [Novilysobacter spongiicola]|uniref:Uncharacterized protein n=1 Tax=Lysobacter spongiicola DSM 21749 TaxID=1122188 RepID=A0A1T4PT63_9GAMM|nr:ankyrin repeat domain-containing protein [Lysobacter spongiicola]SJZ94078.1 hypothetical protein SAMN02745674_01346 [Lysobacter spongiicola DSM 21749]
MADPTPARWPLAVLAAIAAGLALLAGLGGWVAALAGTLCQPLLALAARYRRKREVPDHVRLRRELPPVAILWAVAVAGFGLVVSWPLSALVDSGSLLAALGLSTVVGVSLLVLWRWWPVWQGLERDGGALGDHRRALGGLEPGAWRGLGVAVAVAAVCGLVVALAWPGLLAAPVRWLVALALLLGSAGLHVWLQQVMPAQALEYLYEESAEDAVDPAGATVPEVLPAAPVAAIEPVGPVPDAVADVVRAPSEPLEPDLYEAARSGRVERALELIEAGADPHAMPPAADRDQRSLAALAAVLPDLRLLRGLIARGVDLNIRHAGLTPLLAATRDSWHGRPDAVMTLLANGADPRATDADGNTPLHFAARSSDPGVAALLRDAAAELESLNHEGLAPLGVACAAGNWRLARFLLERGARPEPVGGKPALLAAAGGEDDDPAGVALLLKFKARVGATSESGRTALHEASLAGHVDIATALLSAGADVATPDGAGSTPVHEAARAGHSRVLELLLEAEGARVPAVVGPDQEGRTPLMLACMAEGVAPPLVERLLALGIDPEQRDHEGKRALELAAAAGRWSLVAILDANHPMPGSLSGVDGDERAMADRAPAAILREGLGEGREHALDAVAALLGPRELGALMHDQEALVPPHQIEWLLARGADPEVRDGSGRTPMELLLGTGPRAVPSLRALLDAAVSPAGRGGLARFLAACASGEQGGRACEGLAVELLDRGADPFGATAAGDLPLTLAVRLGWSQLLDRLLQAGVALDVRDSHGMSALHLAAALGRQDMLKRLIARGASPGLLAADGQTPLGVALSTGRRDLADWLDWRGWPLPGRPLQASDVPAAAIVGDADAVRRLLDLGLSPDAMDAQGCTALLRAAGGGHRAVVDLLLARRADPTVAAESGATALSAAVSMRHAEIVDRLLAAGAELEQRLPGGVTVLMVAAALGLPDLVARLLAAGADVHAVDEQGRTPLHCAAMFGFSARDRTRLVALFDTLLLAGAETDPEDGSAGATPLLLLLGARAEPGTAADEDVLAAGLEQLADHEARLDVQDARGFGPLHLAALHGLMGIVKWLLRAGADPELRDSLNRSPREVAVMRGFIDIAAELGPAAAAGGEVSMARFLRDRS